MIPEITELSLPALICAVAALYSCIRIVLEKNTLRKLPFLNVLTFAVTGIIVLICPTPLGIAAACAYFIGSTLESNAIASTWAKRAEKEKKDAQEKADGEAAQ
ncbi:DUF2109 domain-containing protein [Methanomicrobium mobile]|uniref:DUF2109 domain-containing protein n=1 Tax=Methanomicrobium mobile TaxID=2205 RepID=UPI00069326C3|nr:DUF2109 domain-containing protein [Methanomicrobium mobile]